MAALFRLNHVLSRICLYGGGILMLWLTALNFANVFGRYVLLLPIVWADEILRFSSTWMVMLAAAVVTLEGTHISMESLLGALPRRPRWVLSLAIDLLTMVLAVWLVTIGWQTTMRILVGQQRAPASDIPIWLIYLSWPTAFALFVIFLLERVLRLLMHPGEVAKPAQPIPAE